MRICDRCETPQRQGELIDEQFLCNGCLDVLLVDAQIEAEADEDPGADMAEEIADATRSAPLTLEDVCGDEE